MEAIRCFFQRYFGFGYLHAIGRLFGPGAGVDIPDAMDKPFFSIMGVAAGDRLETVFRGIVDGIYHHVFSKIGIESLPAFGILGHMDRAGAQSDSQIMQHLKGFYKNPTLGHDFVKKIPVGDEQCFLQGVMLFNLYFSQTIWNIPVVVISSHPDKLLPERHFSKAVQQLSIGRL